MCVDHWLAILEGNISGEVGNLEVFVQFETESYCIVENSKGGMTIMSRAYRDGREFRENLMMITHN